MALAAGTSIGPYQVTAPLGAGGMGEVYRARDARLHRDVALKVLPEALASDPERLARLKREAQVLAGLNHPGIAAIYGFEEADGTHALVLELVEGPTLADRLRSGCVPVDEALSIARQIAEALEAAHDVGIVHRDLKPANVKLRPDGIVKVLDFGLAKAVEAPGEASVQAAAAPTVTSPAMTAGGVILGTAAYMSPEQAKGRPADRRSDVWALGVVLYEMLAGRRPFRADDVVDTLAAVLRAEPAWTELPVGTPAGLHRLLRRCLQKDARRRWQHIGDVRLELGEIEQGEQEGFAAAGPPSRRVTTAALVTVAMGFATLGAGLGRWSLPREDPAAAATPVSFRIAYAPGERLADTVRSFGISRDGRHIAYAAAKDGRQQLFLRALDQSDAVAIGGTENATYPVFSPDGGALAFWADGWIKRVPVAGGAATTIAPAQAPRGLAWAPDDRIVFAESALSGLSVVSASGGVPEPLTEVDAARGETNHRWPIVLPDGSGVLFAVQKRSRTELDIEGVSFVSKTRTSVRPGAFPVQILGTGHLVYAAINGDTFAAPFDVQRMALTGPSIPLSERPGYSAVPGMTSAALSPGGTMVSVPLQEPHRRLVVVGRNGTRRVLDQPTRNYQQVRVSPAGRRIAVVTLTGISEWDIWTMDTTAAGPLKRLTVNRFSTWPVWESEETLVYSAFEDGIWRVLSQKIDLNQPARTLLSGLTQEPAVLGWLWDRSLAYTLILPQQNLFVGKDGEEPQTLALPETGRFGRMLIGLSPNGRWLTYASDVDGRREAYMTALSDGGITRQVSRNGGDLPVWAKSGEQVFYRRALPDRLTEFVRVPVGPDGPIGQPTVVTTGDQLGDRGAFDVFPDGSLLLLEELPAPSPNLDVVVNWAALRGLAPLSR
jgi:hypothetical protein